MKARITGNYLMIPFKYGTNKKVALFVPKSFIEHGDLNTWTLQPSNFLGVDLKQVLDNIKDED